MLNLNTSMLSNAFSTGARPIWENDTYRHLVLANSLAKSPNEQQAQGQLTIAGVIDAIGILTAQLGALNSGGIGAAIKPVLARAHASFARMMELRQRRPSEAHATATPGTKAHVMASHSRTARPSTFQEFPRTPPESVKA